MASPGDQKAKEDALLEKAAAIKVRRAAVSRLLPALGATAGAGRRARGDPGPQPDTRELRQASRHEHVRSPDLKYITGAMEVDGRGLQLPCRGAEAGRNALGLRATRRAVACGGYDAGALGYKFLDG